MRGGNYKSIHGMSPISYPPEYQTKLNRSKIFIFTLERFDTRDDINPDTFKVSHRKIPDFLKINTVY